MPRKPSRKDLDRDLEGNYVVPDPALEREGREIAQVYYQVLRDRYQVTQYPSKRNAWIWYRAAELARQKGLGAVEFVTAQLAAQATSGTFWPQGMCSWVVAEKALQAQPTRETVQACKYQAQLALYNKLVPLYGLRVYRDEFFPFSPVIRSALASRQGDTVTIARYADEAALEAAEYQAARDIKEALLCIPTSI